MSAYQGEKISIPVTLNGNLQTIMNGIAFLYGACLVNQEKEFAEDLMKQTIDHVVEKGYLKREEVELHLGTIRDQLQKMHKQN